MAVDARPGGGGAGPGVRDGVGDAHGGGDRVPDAVVGRAGRDARPRGGRRWRRSPGRRARCAGSPGRSGRTRRGWRRTASWWRHAWRRVGDRIRDPAAFDDYEVLLERQAPVTVAHEVTFTVTVDLRRVRRRRQLGPLDAALAALGEELELFTQRLDGAGMAPSAPLSPDELTR